MVFSSWARADVAYEVVRNTDGQPAALTRADAARACAERGTHLATAREFAEIARERGADGPREARVADQVPASNLSASDIQGPRAEAYLNLVAGFEPVLKLDVAGKPVVDFYYSRQHFKCWAGDLDHDFWTSTDLGEAGVYLFLGREANLPGALTLAVREASATHAALCVK